MADIAWGLGFTLIAWVSILIFGVPLLEKKYASRPDFEKYKKKASVFFCSFQELFNYIVSVFWYAVKVHLQHN